MLLESLVKLQINACWGKTKEQKREIKSRQSPSAGRTGRLVRGSARAYTVNYRKSRCKICPASPASRQLSVVHTGKLERFVINRTAATITSVCGLAVLHWLDVFSICLTLIESSVDC